MGKGTYIGNALNLYVSFDEELELSADGQLPSDISNLLRASARRLYEATDGKIYIHNIFWVDGGWGRNIADLYFRNTSNGSVLGRANLEGLGVFGSKSETFSVTTPVADPETLAATTVHELGHYLWGLRDEYAGPNLPAPIELAAQQDYENNVPDENRKVFLSPLFDPTNQVTGQPYDLVDCEVQLYFDGVLQTRIVQEVEVSPDGTTELRIVFSAGFNSPPSTADNAIAYVRPSGVCSDSDSKTCVMGARGANVADEEFCVAGNHDPDKVTAQSAHHAGLSCWETIAAWMVENTSTQVIAPAVNELNTGLPPENQEPGIQKLEKEHRIVLVLDRSGSMSEADKIEGARAGLEFWISNLAVEEDFLGLIWFDHEIKILIDIRQVSQISDLDTLKEEALELDPRGSTNIHDALDKAADMLIQESTNRGPAVQQSVLLLTDGEHNVPPPSTVALDVIDKFKENGIQIFTVGLGTAETVDRDVLEELAYGTAGRPVMDRIDADNQTIAPIQTLLARLSEEIRGDIAAIVEIDVDELLGGSPLDAYIRKWQTTNVRSELKDILKAADVSKLSELRENEPGRVGFASMWVEEGAQTARFSVHSDSKSRLWVYLVDPEGKFLPLNQGRWFTGRYPFEGVVVPKPAPGRWVVVAIRPEPGPAAKAIFLGGITNREIVVSGDSDKVVPLGSGCRIWARAYWENDLSGLSVRAKIRDPEGVVHQLILDDTRADEPSSGEYQGYFVPSLSGHHEGEIQLASDGKAQLAAGLDRMLHAEYDPTKGHSLDLSSKKGRFVRRIQFYFDAGTRPIPKDQERALGLIGKFKPSKRFGKRLSLRPVREKATTKS